MNQSDTRAIHRQMDEQKKREALSQECSTDSLKLAIDVDKFCSRYGFCFSDVSWNFKNTDDTVPYERHRCITWSGLPKNLADDLKMLAIIRIDHSIAARLNPKADDLPEIKTVTDELQHFCNMLRLWLSDEANSRITRLDQLDITDLHDLWALTSEGQQKRLKKVLAFLVNPFVQAQCTYPARWNLADLEELKVTYEAEPFDPIPVEQVLFIDHVAMQDVLSFLTALGKEIHDHEHHLDHATDSWGAIGANVCEQFNDYMQLCEIIQRNGSDDRREYSSFLDKKRRKHGEGWPGCISQLIEETAVSAQVLIALNVPGRISDWGTFTKDISLVKFRDYYVLRGNNVKTGSDEPELCEVWPIAPHVVDAVHCLEELVRMKTEPALFQSFAQVASAPAYTPTRWGQRVNNWYLNKLLRAGKQNWLTRAEDGAYLPKENLHAHRFRHTLPHLFQIANLGVAEASYLLKHTIHCHQLMHEDFEIARQTGMYGRTLFNMVDVMVVAAERARLEALKSSFDPEAVYAGENAKQKLEQLNEVYRATIKMWDARGIVHNGKDSFIQSVLEQGYTFVDVGVGSCMGTDLSSGYLPPCKTSSKCSPRHCRNAIISQRHAKPIQMDVIEIFKRNHTHSFPWTVDARETVIGHLQSLIELNRLENDFLSQLAVYDDDHVLEDFLIEARTAVKMQGTAS